MFFPSLNLRENRMDALMISLRVVLACVLSPLTSWTYDVYVFYTAATGVLYGDGLYGTNVYGYPPLWAFVFIPLFHVVSLFSGPMNLARLDLQLSDISASTGMVNAYVTSPVFNIVLKLPLLVADIAVALYLRRIVREIKGPRAGTFALLLWTLNPSTFVTSFVQGQFDLLVGMSLVLSAVALYRRDYFFSGIWIAIGTLLKIIPAMLIPLYLLLIIARELPEELEGPIISRAKKAVQKTFRPLVAFVLGGCLLTLLFIFPLFQFLFILRYRFETVYTGGLSMWSILLFPTLPNNIIASVSFPSFISYIMIGSAAALIVLIGLYAIHTRSSLDFAKIISLQTTAIVVLLLSFPLVQPQYICWLIPSAILTTGVTGRLGSRTLLLSCFATLFSISLLSIAAFFYPAALFTNLVSVDQLNSLNFMYWSGPLTALRSVLLFVGGFGGFLFLVLLIIPDNSFFRKYSFVRKFLPESDQTGVKIELPTTPGKSITIWKVKPFHIYTIMVVLLVVFGQVIASPQYNLVNTPTASVDSYNYNSISNTLNMTYDLSSGLYMNEINVIMCSVSQQGPPQSIYIYYDDAHSSIGSRRSGILSFGDHLGTDLRRAGFESSIVYVDANGLRDVFLALEPAIVIALSGVFPDTVLTNTTDLVGPWLRSGGILFWAGATIGYYSSHAGQASVTRLGPLRQESILGFVATLTPFPDPVSAESETELSSALSLRYNQIQWGYSLEALQQHNATILGKVGYVNATDLRCSIASIAVDSGFAILFGGGITNSFSVSAEDAMSTDISRILITRVMYLNSNVSYEHVMLEAGAHYAGSMSVQTNSQSSDIYVTVVIFQDLPLQRYLLAEHWASSSS
jgi:hypothetical protein